MPQAQCLLMPCPEIGHKLQSVEAESEEQKIEIAAVAEDMEVLVRENQAATHQLGRAEAAVQQLQADLDQVCSSTASDGWTRCFVPTKHASAFREPRDGHGMSRLSRSRSHPWVMERSGFPVSGLWSHGLLCGALWWLFRDCVAVLPLHTRRTCDHTILGHLFLKRLLGKRHGRWSTVLGDWWGRLKLVPLQAHEQRMRLEQALRSRDKHVAELQRSCDVGAHCLCIILQESRCT